MTDHPRGALIVFEGIDNSGKSTQKRAVSSYLKDIGEFHVKTRKYPDVVTVSGEAIAKALKQNVDEHTLHLLHAANRWETKQELEDLLKQGYTVILDRYYYSGIAYSYARNPDISADWCLACEKGLLKPDKVFYFKIDVRDSIIRGEIASEGIDCKPPEPWEEDEGFLSVVKSVYETKLFDQDCKWRKIDATQTIQRITEELVLDILYTYEKVKHTPLEYI